MEILLKKKKNISCGLPEYGGYIYSDTGINGLRNTWKHGDTGIQGYRDTGIEVYTAD